MRSTKPKAGSTVSEAPHEVVIRYDEPVELAFGGVEVFDADGNRVDGGETEYASEDRTTIRIRLASSLGDGQYSVEWRIVAADGHPREGRFRFRLNQAAPPSPTDTMEATSPGAAMAPAPPRETGGSQGAGALPDVLFGIARWVLFASLLLLVGLGSFALAVWRPFATGRLSTEVDEAFHTRWRRLMLAAWAGAIIASAVSLVLEGAVAADVPLGEAASGEILGPLLGTRFGVVTVARLILLVPLGAVFLGVRTSPARRVLVPAEAGRSLGAAAAPAPFPWASLSVWVVVALAVLATVSLVGHAGSSSPVVVGMTADVLHLAAGAVWIGGLIGLVAVALPGTRLREDGERVAVLAPVVSRFSAMAVVAVAVMAATGAVRGWMEIRTLAGLTGESYGVALLVKLAVVIPLVVLGGINNRWTKPRIRRAAEDAASTGTGAAALRTLNRLVLIEVLLAAVVLGVTAILANLPPPAGGMDAGH